ncbi:flagellar assembly protein FliH [Marinobacterium sediminicola]|uniref:Flagellar assembly protein FliH n=1 Tax=Marinobacterium sediminicola TaxID=518898 RepID=A0ABY1RYG5_9GAMM|nr:flagellar assembly protein FliH [Marinobacterium sediminicola]ULG68771.1 flagellar assembly protein FliH [Marinobacterium sediminicola]SMR73300.1 flagellar assembly protein FliH [Marinobacterium sediminicola]
MKNDAPIRIRAAEAGPVERWLPPDVGAEAPVVQALARKPQQPLAEVDISVVEEEIFAEKLTLSQWEELCEAARQEGYAEGLRQGQDEGRKQGYEQGLQQGLEAGQSEISSRIQQLDALLQQLQTPLEQQREALESTLIQLVVELSEATVKAELSLNIDLLLQSAREALSQLPEGSGKVVLSVHPQQHAALSPLVDDLNLSLVADESLLPGSCRVDSGSCRVDYQVEQRFRQVADQLLARLIKTVDSATT